MDARERTKEDEGTNPELVTGFHENQMGQAKEYEDNTTIIVKRNIVQEDLG